MTDPLIGHLRLELPPDTAERHARFFSALMRSIRSEQPSIESISKDVTAAPQLVREPSSTGTLAVLNSAVPDLSGFDELRIWAETFADQQDHRKRIMNRLGLKADGTPQKTGAHVPPERFAGQVEAMQHAEHLTELALHRCYRRVVPMGIREWQQNTHGIGEHLLARLLGALGHPRIATPYHWEGDGEDRKLIPDLPFERTVRQLWSYCGRGDADRKKRKGMSAEEAFALGNPTCKMLTYLIAERAVMAQSTKSRVTPNGPAEPMLPPADPTTFPEQSRRSAEANNGPVARDTSTESTGIAVTISAPVPFADQPTCVANPKGDPADRRYRSVYDQRRALTKTTHADWTDGHSHNDALRIVGKEILRDLWSVS